MGIFDEKFLKFVIIGALNTLCSFFMIFLLYNFLNLGYWGSTAFVYMIGILITYFANRKYTFNYGQDKFDVESFLKYIILTVFLYLFSFSFSKAIFPYFIKFFLKTNDLNIIEQLTIIFSMCLYTFLNFLGQKFFVFR